MLKALRPAAVDLQRIRLLRDASLQDLSDHQKVSSLLLRLGLNDEGMHEFPACLHDFCGDGLRLWQYPNQFGKYLVQLSTLEVHSYLEIGVRHGGSFIVTTEYLMRFNPRLTAIGIDVIPWPSMTEYRSVNPRASFHAFNSQSIEFMQFVEMRGPFDLVFIDSHHEESQCRQEVSFLEKNTNMIALHDISNASCPGVAQVWQELKASNNFICFEYVDQYLESGPYMGIGLAVKPQHYTDVMSAIPTQTKARL